VAYAVMQCLSVRLSRKYTRILKCLPWFNINEHIEYKLLSLLPTEFLQPVSL